MLRLVARQPVLHDLRRRGLSFSLCPVVCRGVVSGLRRHHRALGACYLGPRGHVIQLKNELALGHQVALLRIHGLHRGGKRAVELVVRNRFHVTVRAHGVLEHLVLCARHAHRQPVP